MMRLDAHQHFWQYNPLRDVWIDESMQAIRRDFLPDDLAPLLEAHGLDGCVAVQAGQSEMETHFLLELADNHPFIKGVVGWVNLCHSLAEARLEYFAQFPGLKGFRHIVQAEPDDAFLLRSDFQRGIAALAQHGFTYDILIFPRQLPAAIRFADQFPNQPFVLDHLAKPPVKTGDTGAWKRDIRELARRPNVCCKVSGLVTEADWKSWRYEDLLPYLDIVLEAFGPQRLMYGSDWPVCLLAARYDEVYAVAERWSAALSANERAGIMGENARQFYKIRLLLY